MISENWCHRWRWPIQLKSFKDFARTPQNYLWPEGFGLTPNIDSMKESLTWMMDLNNLSSLTTKVGKTTPAPLAYPWIGLRLLFKSVYHFGTMDPRNPPSFVNRFGKYHWLQVEVINFASQPQSKILCQKTLKPIGLSLLVKPKLSNNSLCKTEPCLYRTSLCTAIRLN